VAAALMRVLLTRPHADGEALAAMLRRRGHAVVVSPVMEIRFVEGAQLELAGVQAILATSANGIRALARRTSRRDAPVFAVGPQTAAEARALGFASVKDAQGDSIALAKAVKKWAVANAGILLHPTAKDHTPHLATVLSEEGFHVRTEPLYETIEMPRLTQEAVAQLHAQETDAVMLFSPRSAKLFSTAVGRADLREAMPSLRAICISSAAAEPVSPLGLKEIAIAISPNQDSMIALLETST
jgi:uroporphyrinogen-III synthase